MALEKEECPIKHQASTPLWGHLRARAQRTSLRSLYSRSSLPLIYKALFSIFTTWLAFLSTWQTDPVTASSPHGAPLPAPFEFLAVRQLGHLGMHCPVLGTWFWFLTAGCSQGLVSLHSTADELQQEKLEGMAPASVYRLQTLPADEAWLVKGRFAVVTLGFSCTFLCFVLPHSTPPPHTCPGDGLCRQTLSAVP